MDRRKSYFSGTWYPGTAEKCESAISSFINNYKTEKDTSKIGIVPHAGWTFSGQIAARVIYNLSLNKNVDTVILIGGHLPAYDKVYSMRKAICETPLGDLVIDYELTKDIISGIDVIEENGSDYEPDNTTELQLPFIKYFFNTNNIVILRVPPNKTAFKIAENIKVTETKFEKEFAVICSTDLTHYGHRFGMTSEGIGVKAVNWVKNINDKSILDKALAVDYEGLLEDANSKSNACCGGSFAAGVKLASLYELSSHLVDYKTSYDIYPDDASNIVGYSGIIY